ncbi:MAG: FAD-dependent oxidoreductase [Deltaproteobacteria bacterium]|nr:FAD-dependent oxidoreductase [Deltaproteobacteria bacterium]
MAALAQMNGALWQDQARCDPHPPLREDLAVDVVVAGGGITGLTTALLCASDGRRVALLESERIGAGTSGASSAQVSVVPDAGYRALLSRVGASAGVTYLLRLSAALEFMDALIGAERLDCEWRRVPAYWFAADAAGWARLQDEHSAAQRLGQACRLTQDVPLPWPTSGALQFGQQAMFHPVQYLAGLARVARDRGVRLFEQTPVTGWEEDGDGIVVRTPAARVRGQALVLATHTPLGANVLQTEMQAMQSHILIVRTAAPLPPAIYWDTAEPYHYLRAVSDGGAAAVLIGGADHKTGQGGAPGRAHAALSAYARERFGDAVATRWWSAQLYVPADGLPYIGRSPLSHHVFVATGFAGVGLVQGSMAAMELAALLRGEQRESPWKATRMRAVAAPRVLSEGIDVARCWVGDRLAPAPRRGLDALGSGEGQLMQVDGHKRAVYRDEAGRLHVLSPVCPHLGCLVRWNGSARSWDCPCHGSRFAPTGEVLEGPALSGLERTASSAPYAGMAPVTSAAAAQQFDADKG